MGRGAGYVPRGSSRHPPSPPALQLQKKTEEQEATERALDAKKQEFAALFYKFSELNRQHSLLLGGLDTPTPGSEDPEDTAAAAVQDDDIPEWGLGVCPLRDEPSPAPARRDMPRSLCEALRGPLPCSTPHALLHPCA